MPTIAPSYLYAIFALITVSGILIFSFAAYASTLRAIPEFEQLENLLDYIGSKSYELVVLTTVANSSSEATLPLPSAIGNRQFWIRLKSESSGTWVEGALGLIHEGNVTSRIYLPKSVSAFGNYSSGYGPALLECYITNSTINLYLSAWRDKT